MTGGVPFGPQEFGEGGVFALPSGKICVAVTWLRLRRAENDVERCTRCPLHRPRPKISACGRVTSR